MSDLCRAGLHEMSGDNLGVQRSTGRQFCRACRNARRRKAREARAERRAARSETPTCRKGHPLVSDNLHTTAKGEEVCRACLDLANLRRRERRWRAKQAEQAPPPEERQTPTRPVVTPGVVRSYGGPGAQAVRGEAAARYRLARMVRQQRP